MRRLRRLATAALVAVSAGAAAQLITDDLAAPGAASPAGVTRGAGVLSAGGGVVWAEVAGSIYRSSDGGERFVASLLDRTPLDLCACASQAYFVGAEHAWMAMPADPRELSDEVVARTSDGGSRWTAGPALAGSTDSWAVLGYDVAFADARHGFVVASGAGALGGTGLTTATLLWRTADGGSSWQAVPAAGLPLNDAKVGYTSPCDLPGDLSLAMATPELGFLSGGACDLSPPGLWQTSDGGRRWSRAELAEPPGGWPSGGPPEAAAPVITSSGTVLDEVTTAGGGLVVERLQRDGVFTVAGELLTGQYGRPAGLDVIDAERLALPASGGTWSSKDGGRSWRFAATGLDLAALGPMSLSAGPSGVLHGVVAAAAPDATGLDDGGVTGPVALLTTDSGQHWTAVGRLVDPPGGFDPDYDTVALDRAGDGYLAGRAGIAAIHHDARSRRTVWSGGLPVTALQLQRHGPTVALTADSLLATSAPGRPWRVLDEPRAGGLSAVAFAGRSVAYGAVCGDEASFEPPGELVESSDGGEDWQVVSLPPDDPCPTLVAPPDGELQQPATVCVASPRLLYALGGPGEAVLLSGGQGGVPPFFHATLFRSDDGGRSWQRVAAAPGDGLLSCTGGVTWTTISLGMTMPLTTYDVSVDGGRHFCARHAVGPAGPRYLRTAGCPLPTVTSPGTSSSLAPLPGTSEVLLSSCVTCITRPPYEVVRLQASDDEGRSWTPPSTVSGVVGVAAASFPSPDSGVVLGSVGPGSGGPWGSSTLSLVATSNGGRSWKHVATFAAP